MKILYDHQAFTMQRHGGVSRCFVELYKHLPKEVKAKIAVNETDNAYLREIGIGNPYGYNHDHFIMPIHFPFKGRLFRMWNHVKYKMPYQPDNTSYCYDEEYVKQESIRQLKRGDFDVFHPTFYDDYFLPYLKGKPFVLTIHDMIPELYPQYFDQECDMQILGKRKLATLASAIIAVSEKTKEDVVNILHVQEQKVRVIYHGSEHIKKFQSSKVSEFQEYRPYILYVGERWCYKNFDSFVREVAQVLNFHPELKVVCTGSSFSDEELHLFSALGIKDRIIPHWVRLDEEFSSLYHEAVCFVYPSEYEGFGISILEAYKADCPVMLNNASCFPEIAGDAAIYFTMTPQHTDFAEKFEQLYSWTDEERASMLQKQHKRLQLYSWQKAAQQMSEVYKSVL